MGERAGGSGGKSGEFVLLAFCRPQFSSPVDNRPRQPYLKRMSEEIRINTLGTMLDNDMRMNAWCFRCQKGREMDLAALVRKLGRDHPINISGRLRCSRCGSKETSITISPPAPKLNGHR